MSFAALKQEMPPEPPSPVRAKHSPHGASLAPEMKIFWPLRT